MGQTGPRGRSAAFPVTHELGSARLVAAYSDFAAIDRPDDALMKRARPDRFATTDSLT